MRNPNVPYLRVVFAVGALTMALAVTASADVPQLINYQGVLTSGGTPVTTTVTVVFNLWDDPNAGTSLWSETQNVTPDADGRFSVILGSVTPIPDSCFWGTDVYLGVKVGTDLEMTPRQRLTATGYAFSDAWASNYTARGIDATVGGGYNNTASADNSTVGGGAGNAASGEDGTVGGGAGNVATGVSSTVGGGAGNAASAHYGTIGGGLFDSASANYSTVGGGSYNSASANYSTVGGGSDNAASAKYSTVGGGSWNMARNQFAVVAGGGGFSSDSNSALGYASAILGGLGNIASGDSSTIGAGIHNTASGVNSTIAGGRDNTASGDYSSIGGGTSHTADDTSATVSGGGGNLAIAKGATVSGGIFNEASARLAVVGGGSDNHATGEWATVAGGSSNYAAGEDATVPGGYDNTAAGDRSFAAGRHAKANHSGSFVWADNTIGADFTSTAENRFHIRATNGLYQKADNTGYGAMFENYGDGDGIRAWANVSKGNVWAALYATNNGTSPGIYGYSSGGDAAYLDGNVTVTGTLSKGGGSFKIDHPLDPQNKYLYHSFVESPDMMNVYNGNVVLDGNGEAVVQLPDYFEALNRDFRYQLTAIGAPGPNLYVADKISGHQFRIAGGRSGMEVSWQVTGIRQDAFANAHRIEVEVDKPATERGKYLHPEEHGMPRSLGLSSEKKRDDSR